MIVSMAELAAPVTPELELVYSEEEICARIAEHGAAFHHYCQTHELTGVVLVVNLEGATIYAAALRADLERRGVAVTAKEIKIQSYAGTKSGQLTITKRPRLGRGIKDKLIVLVDEIFDQGRALSAGVREIARFHPSHLVCSVVVLRRTADCTHIFTGDPAVQPSCVIAKDQGVGISLLTRPFVFEGKEFLAGYGLDINGKYRELPAIYKLVN